MTNEEAIDKLMRLYRTALECTDEKMENALRIAIEALEKQIQMEPIKDGVFSSCPNCKEVEFGLNQPNYCDNCGQKLNWRENE